MLRVSDVAADAREPGGRSSPGFTRRGLLRTAGAGAGLLTLPGLLAACGGSTPSSTAAGGTATAAGGAATVPAASGVVDYYGFEGLDFAGSKVMERWLRANHMRVSSRYWTSFKDGASTFLSGRADGIDAVHVATCTYAFLREAGEILQPLDPGKIPNLRNLLPGFQGTDRPWYIDGELWYVPLGNDPFALMWDAGRVSTPPTSWDELTDPRFKGRLAVYNDPLVHIWTITEILRLGPQGRLPKSAGKKAAEYLKRQVDNARLLATSVGDIVTAFANGDVDACFCGAPLFAVLAQQSGAKEVRFNMEPTDGNTLSTEGMGLAATADNPDAVHAWINEGLEPVPNADYGSLLGGAPTVSGAHAHMDPAIGALYPPGTIERLARKFPYSRPLPIESDEYLTDAEWTEVWTPVAGT